MMSHVDLFSGVGGFALASHWAGFQTVAFCDNNPWCQTIIRKHWTGVPIHDDIRNFPGRDYRGSTLLTGGFPCQPFSQCGKRRGKNDDRYLWPEMLEIIKVVRPTWVVAENVYNVVRMVLPTVIADLEAERYRVVVLLLPAHGVGAPHRRRRAFVVAESLDTNSNSLGLHREEMHEHGKGNQIELRHQQGSVIGSMVSPQIWERIDPRVFGVADGISDRMDEDERKERKERIKGLGNAVVPLVAYQILKAIADVHNDQNKELTDCKILNHS